MSSTLYFGWSLSAIFGHVSHTDIILCIDGWSLSAIFGHLSHTDIILCIDGWSLSAIFGHLSHTDIILCIDGWSLSAIFGHLWHTDVILCIEKEGILLSPSVDVDLLVTSVCLLFIFGYLSSPHDEHRSSGSRRVKLCSDQ